jgi:glycosyltransferase involved in cell wall biosynthesis
MNYTFAVIICTYNRCESLKDTLDSLVSQECDWNYVPEVIIVDNNSTDDTEELVKSYALFFKEKLKYIKETKQGKSHALNSAIKASQSDVLACTDDDVILDPKWLSVIIQFFDENEVDVMSGRTLPLYPDNTPAWVKRNQYNLRGPIVSYDHGEDVIDYRSGKIGAFIGAHTIFKKSVFDKAGLFHTTLGTGQGTLSEDIEMFERAHQVGSKIFYNGKALIWHKTDPKRMTLRYIAKWNYQHGKSVAILEPIGTKQNLRHIHGVPTYLFRSTILKFFKLFLTIFQQDEFMKNWCSFYFNLGMLAGYIKFRPSKTLKERLK